jgi:crossover junction endodeoxyribonuclease RusA
MNYVEITMRMFPPDRRRRDLDNCFKAVMDVMEGKVYGNDFQVVKIVATKHKPVPGGRVEIEVTETDGVFP